MSIFFFSKYFLDQSSAHCPLCQCATVGPSKSNTSNSKLCPNARSYMSPRTWGKNQFFVRQGQDHITKWKLESVDGPDLCSILDLTISESIFISIPGLLSMFFHSVFRFPHCILTAGSKEIFSKLRCTCQ